MPYNPQNYRRIRAEYESKYLRAREEAERRRREVELLLPEVAAIHRQLSHAGLEILRVSLEHGDDTAAREAAIAALRSADATSGLEPLETLFDTFKNFERI